MRFPKEHNPPAAILTLFVCVILLIVFEKDSMKSLVITDIPQFAR